MPLGRAPPPCDREGRPPTRRSRRHSVAISTPIRKVFSGPLGTGAPSVTVRSTQVREGAGGGWRGPEGMGAGSPFCCARGDVLPQHPFPHRYGSMFSWRKNVLRLIAGSYAVLRRAMHSGKNWSKSPFPFRPPVTTGAAFLFQSPLVTIPLTLISPLNIY